jgi:hypothetical protein
VIVRGGHLGVHEFHDSRLYRWNDTDDHALIFCRSFSQMIPSYQELRLQFHVCLRCDVALSRRLPNVEHGRTTPSIH